jgi:hypothetical protein
MRLAQDHNLIEQAVVSIPNTLKFSSHQQQEQQGGDGNKPTNE